jgi:hypothetical protein
VHDLQSEKLDDFIQISQQQKKEKDFSLFTFLHTIATKQEKSASF